MTSLDASLGTVTDGAVRRRLEGKKLDIGGTIFMGALLLSLLICLLFIIVLLQQVLTDGVGTFQDRGWDFITSPLSGTAANAGVIQGIIGTLMIAVFVVVIALPLGIATAVYLEEYAPANRFTSFITLNIRNLAGVPSVVYGLLGLTIFVGYLGSDLSNGGLTGGKSVISAGITLSLLVLPIVIITASEAIRAVPQSLREGGYGVGATQWEVTKTLVLPNAFAGIMTGTVLAISRALGETAPLILVGAIISNFYATPNQGFVEYFTAPNQNFWDQLQGPFTALPIIVYNWSRQAQAEFKTDLASAAIIVLLVITFACNAIAVFLRNRYEKDW